jgi:ATP-dependent DNA helicase RecQ
LNQPREVLKYLVEVEGLERDQTFSCDLNSLSSDLGFSPDQTRRALQSLHAAGQIAYRQPFRGRGQRILKRISPYSLPIDFAAISRRAELDRRKLRKMIDYGYSTKCLRGFILEYFGETRRSRLCRNCSACLGSSEPLAVRVLNEEETIVVKKALSCVARMKNRFGKRRVAEVLTGAKVKAIEELGLTSLSTYGILNGMSITDVTDLLDALLDAQLLEIKGGDYPVLALTESGRNAMMGKTAVEMIFPQDAPPQLDAKESPLRGDLFDELRSLRRRLAKENGMAPYMVFHDEVLREISRRQPDNLQELRRVPGIGKRKLQQWGSSVIETVRAFRKR